MELSEVKRFGARKMPTRLVLTPTDKPGESTTVIYELIEFDVDEIEAVVMPKAALKENAPLIHSSAPGNMMSLRLTS